ncbi:Serine/threonine-protein kinase par-4 [Diplonema papillatum]|nr:Serine/threonine-protein kinase par-4 [Diplonema papillatum]KAJ9471758.1 Serine/threonine-protein kinase par-4 [Diplonema papillatum]
MNGCYANSHASEHPEGSMVTVPAHSDTTELSAMSSPTGDHYRLAHDTSGGDEAAEDGGGAPKVHRFEQFRAKKGNFEVDTATTPPGANLHREVGGVDAHGYHNVPMRVESEMVLDDLAEGVQCQSPVGLNAAQYHNKKFGTIFRTKMVRQFICGPLIGEGAFGKVRLALNTAKPDEVVALKVVNKRLLRKVRNGDEVLKNEAAVQKRLAGAANTLPLLHHFEDELKGKVYLVFPFAMGSLQDLVDHCRKSSQRLPVDVLRTLASQLLNGIRGIHACSIVHKDVKSENCMLMRDLTLLISDFGTAEETPRGKLTSGAGTPSYSPPEVAEGAVQHDPYAADIWAAGVTIYHVCTLRLPFHGGNLWKVYESIVGGHVDYGRVPCPLLADLLRSMLQRDAPKRPQADVLLGHAFFDQSNRAGDTDDHPAAPAQHQPQPDTPGLGVDGGLAARQGMARHAVDANESDEEVGGAFSSKADCEDDVRRRLLGLTVDWKSGVKNGDGAVKERPASSSNAAGSPRAKGAAAADDDDDFVATAEPGIDAIRCMREEEEEMHVAFARSLAVALEGGMISADQPVVDYVALHGGVDLPKETPSTTLPTSPGDGAGALELTKRQYSTLTGCSNASFRRRSDVPPLHITSDNGGASPDSDGLVSPTYSAAALANGSLKGSFAFTGAHRSFAWPGAPSDSGGSPKLDPMVDSGLRAGVPSFGELPNDSFAGTVRPAARLGKQPNASAFGQSLGVRGLQGMRSQSCNVIVHNLGKDAPVDQQGVASRERRRSAGYYSHPSSGGSPGAGAIRRPPPVFTVGDNDNDNDSGAESLVSPTFALAASPFVAEGPPFLLPDALQTNDLPLWRSLPKLPRNICSALSCGCTIS